MSTQFAFFNLTQANATRVPGQKNQAVIHLRSGEFGQCGLADIHLSTEDEARRLLDAAQAALYLLTTKDTP